MPSIALVQLQTTALIRRTGLCCVGGRKAVMHERSSECHRIPYTRVDSQIENVRPHVMADNVKVEPNTCSEIETFGIATDIRFRKY